MITKNRSDGLTAPNILGWFNYRSNVKLKVKVLDSVRSMPTATYGE